MKVMVSLPESTVRRLDELAEIERTSRSAVVRRLADEAAVDAERRRRAKAMALYGSPQPRTGDALSQVKADRRAR